MTFRILLARPGSLALLVLNAIGAVVYVVLASDSWAIPQEAGLHSRTGEPFIRALSVLRVFGVFSLINLTWGMRILACRQWQGGSLWLLAALIWWVAVVTDFAHH
jgi:hypothetical protein